jgi:excinuclease ABC subunit C
MALAAARDVGVSVGPGSELSIVALAKERDEETEAAGAPAPAADGAEAAAPVAPAPPVPDKGKAAAAPRKPDRVFLPHAKDAIPIRPSSAEMFVLQALRDEAHRFAVSFHRGQRRRLTLRSALASIPGVGLGRQRQLLRHFGSIKRVREASVDELVGVPGMTRPAAEAVFAHWARQPVDVATRDAPVTTDNDAGKQAEELAIDDAFAAVEADQVPVSAEEKKQEI